MQPPLPSRSPAARHQPCQPPSPDTRPTPRPPLHLPPLPSLQIATIGYGDIVPASLAETLVVLAVQIVGVMFFGLLLSTIGYRPRPTRAGAGGMAGCGAGACTPALAA